MALIYRKNNVFVLSHCISCSKGIFNICGLICLKCKMKSCNKCGRNYLNRKYHNEGECIPIIWTPGNYYKINYSYIKQCALELRITITVLTSACRTININMFCARKILSYYYKANISNKDISFILERFVFLRNFFNIV